MSCSAATRAMSRPCGVLPSLRGGVRCSGRWAARCRTWRRGEAACWISRGLVPRGGQFGDILGSAFAAAGTRDFASQMMLVDVATYLPGDILTKVDRASMAVSLEARVPLLDQALVEFALALPADLKIRGRAGKQVLRRAIRELVPSETLEHPKLGFAVPLGPWFRGPLRHRIDQLATADGGLYDFLDRKAVRRLAREHLIRRRDHSTALWRALVLQLWLAHLESGRLARPVPRSLVAF